MLAADRGVRFLVSLLNGALIARALGTYEFGLLAQVLLAVAVMDVLVSMGIPSVLGPRVAMSDIEHQGPLLLHALGLRASATLCCGFIAAAVYLSNVSGLSEANSVFVVCVMLTLIVMNWALCDGFLQGVGRPEDSALLKSLVAVGFLLIRYVHVEAGIPDALSLAFLNCAEQAAISLVLLSRCRSLARPYGGTKDTRGRMELLRLGLIMWGSQLFTLAYMRIDQAVILVLSDKVDLAKYVVAVQLAEQTFTLPIILCAVYVEKVANLRRQSDSYGFRREIIRLYRLGFVLTAVMAATAALLSNILVPSIYGSKYAESASLFAILVFSVPFVMLGGINSLVLLTGNKAYVQLRRTFICSLVCVPMAVCGWYLAGLFGLAFAAVAVQGLGNLVLNKWLDREGYEMQLEALWLKTTR